MKKSILFFSTLLLFFSQNLFSQEAKIKLKDFRERSVVIMGVSKDYIFSKNNNFELSDIEKIYFGQKQEKYEHVYKTLSDAGIVISFDHEIIVKDEPVDVKQNTSTSSAFIWEKDINPAEVSQKTIQRYLEEEKYENIVFRLEKFREQRSIGMTLQFVGLGLSLLAVPVLLPELAILGGVASIIGLAVQADAGKHLNFRYKYNKRI